ncbi:MarR family transcriptional regulator [Streptomyces sp. A7024]|uniref:MarR family transcriptional regulator n=1 Tax=Streptomyces coryli TaxID=1128680 RepID=A0A6G4U9I1_9ACTN|nr:MarR family transcriptional regulator [Streptomyces coryli]NGN68889.1 MarR family transcriptional regulator [Streptomyces coryli]
MHTNERTANLLGATALAVTDELVSGPVAASAASPSGAAALIALHANPGISVTELGRRVGLTQSAAVRMVDALARAAMVERRRTANKFTWIYPTDKGRETAEVLIHGRQARLTAALEGLGEDERHTLGALLEKVLDGLYATTRSGPDPEAAHHRICRLCDREACVSDAYCPVGEAEKAARGAGA